MIALYNQQAHEAFHISITMFSIITDVKAFKKWYNKIL